MAAKPRRTGHTGRCCCVALPPQEFLQSQADGHVPCEEPCERNLACGHHCSVTCHHGEACPTCAKPCWIQCDHHKWDALTSVLS